MRNWLHSVGTAGLVLLSILAIVLTLIGTVYLSIETFDALADRDWTNAARFGLPLMVIASIILGTIMYIIEEVEKEKSSEKMQTAANLAERVLDDNQRFYDRSLGFAERRMIAASLLGVSSELTSTDLQQAIKNIKKHAPKEQALAS